MSTPSASLIFLGGVGLLLRIRKRVDRVDRAARVAGWLGKRAARSCWFLVVSCRFEWCDCRTPGSLDGPTRELQLLSRDGNSLSGNRVGVYPVCERSEYEWLFGWCGPGGSRYLVTADWVGGAGAGIGAAGGSVVLGGLISCQDFPFYKAKQLRPEPLRLTVEGPVLLCAPRCWPFPTCGGFPVDLYGPPE